MLVLRLRALWLLPDMAYLIIKRVDHLHGLDEWDQDPPLGNKLRRYAGQFCESSSQIAWSTMRS